MTIRTQGETAGPLFNRLQGQGLHVIVIGEQAVSWTVPAEYRYSSDPVDAKKLITEIALQRALQVVWLAGGHTAVIQRGTTDDAVAQLEADLQSPDLARRRRAAWRAGWLPDWRVIAPLLKALADLETANDAKRSLNRLDVRAVAGIAGDAALPLLELDLHEHDWELRWRAAIALGAVPSEKVLPLLAQALHDEDERVRRAAACSLGSRRNAASLAELTATMNDPMVEVRETTAAGLGCDGSNAALALLQKALTDPAPRVHCAALSALGAFGGDRALALLAPELDSKNQSLREWGVGAVGSIGGPKAGELLEQCAANTDLSSAKWKGMQSHSVGGVYCSVSAPRVVSVLAQVAPEKAWPFLEKMLADPHPDYRRCAIEALYPVDNEKKWTAVEKAFTDPSPLVRSAVVHALGRPGGGARAQAIFRKALEDPDRDVIFQTAWTLARMGDESAVALLASALDSKNPYTRSKAILEVGYELGGDRAAPLLEKAAVHDDPQVRYYAATGAPRLRREKAMALLEHLMEDPVESVRNNAILCLRSVADATLIPHLEKLQTSPAFGTRSAAVYVAGAIGGEAALPLLARALKDPHAGIRCNACEVLGQMGGSMVLPNLERGLADADQSVRLRATLAIGESADPGAVPLLNKAFEDHWPAVGEYAVKALGQIHTPEACQVLIDRLAQEQEPKTLALIRTVLKTDFATFPAAKSALQPYSALEPALQK